MKKFKVQVEYKIKYIFSWIFVLLGCTSFYFASFSLFLPIPLSLSKYNELEKLMAQPLMIDSLWLWSITGLSIALMFVLTASLSRMDKVKDLYEKIKPGSILFTTESNFDVLTDRFEVLAMKDDLILVENTKTEMKLEINLIREINKYKLEDTSISSEGN